MKALAVALWVLTGCYSFTALGRARTVARGRWEVIVAPGATGTAVLGADANIRPAMEAGVRWGATDRLELGLRVGNSGGVASVRIQAVRAESAEYGVDVLLAPGLAYTYTDKLGLELPLLFGINFPGRHQLVIAPRIVDQFRSGLGHPAQFLFVGGSVGFAWQVVNRIALIPEIAVLANVYAEPGFGSFAQAGPALQFALAIAWDP